MYKSSNIPPGPVIKGGKTCNLRNKRKTRKVRNKRKH